MERLFENSDLALSTAKSFKFKRYLFKQLLEANMRMISILGARGVGKTVLMLQMLDSLKLPPQQAIYISLDDTYFAENRLIDFANQFRKLGGKWLFIDEVHKYPFWAQELKNIYDFYTDLKIVFSGSSILELSKAEADLSRRALAFELMPLSFREFVALKHGVNLPVFSIKEIVERHQEIASELKSHFLPIKAFNEYVRFGAYPFFLESEQYYILKLKQIINLTLETDLPAIENVRFLSIYKLKKLLTILAESSPFKPNIEQLAKELKTSRDKLLRYLYLLHKARLITQIRTEQIGNAYMRKPEKIVLNNPNLSFALTDKSPDIGSLRETFFVSQISARYPVLYAKKGDYVVTDYLFEIDGKSKTQKQIAGETDAFIAADNIEIGFGNKIPLWMFGFLY